ncbi:MAG TPA: Ppx/GppA phosphatase family protein [Herpetosiphonaceae bacterium]|nr:Ppx/GppA phosphatase family protein [Herpetosiphonaceae bacterium]
MTRQRIALIDLGSNTTRLIVMAFHPGQSFRLEDQVKETVRLVSGAGESNILQPASVRRAVDALRNFGALVRATDVPEVIGIATSAVRDAHNRDDVLRQITAETGLTFRVVSGEEEAYYAYLGVVNSLPLRDGFVVDIGGGSAQVSLVRDRLLARSTSLPIGAVRMTERFLRSDPPAKAEWRALEDHFDEALGGLDWFRVGSGMQLVGLGGAIRTVATIAQRAQLYPIDRIHAYEISRERVEEICADLRKRKAKERALVPGVSEERADVLLAGALLLRQLMRHSKAASVQICGQGLREGVFYEQFLAGASPPLIPDVRRFAVENLLHAYHGPEAHTAKVCDLALQMFDQLRPLHGYGSWERELLTAGANLHDIGLAVNYYDHHKHSAYIILNSPMPGYTHREVAIIALLARYWRKGTIEIGNLASLLAPGDEQRVARLAALLRIAATLDRSKNQVVTGVRCELDGRVHVVVETGGDATVELAHANQRAGLFRRAFDIEISIE